MLSGSSIVKKIASLTLSFTFFFSQCGFAQVAVDLNLASHIGVIGAQLSVERFRAPHLRYFSYNSASNDFRILIDKGDLKDLAGATLESKGQELLNYFLIGISLPDDNFWVNLRPDSGDHMIPELLARTDIGKIMLEADVQLKKDTAGLTSPQTPNGKLYWDKLYQKAHELFGTQEVTIPTLNRPWIVPGEIIIRQSQNSAYIYKSNLKVCLEQDHLKDSVSYNFKDPRLKELNEYSAQLIRELIIPQLTKEVNNAKRYSSLRQAYNSLILARWFKSRFAGKAGEYSSRINSSNLEGLTSRENWSPSAYFKQYQDSFNKGEYNIKAKVSSFSGASIRTYFSGGIEFAKSMQPATANGFSGKADIENAARGAGLELLSGQPGKLSLIPPASSAKKSSSPVAEAPTRDRTGLRALVFDVGRQSSLLDLVFAQEFKDLGYSVYWSLDNPGLWASADTILITISQENFDQARAVGWRAILINEKTDSVEKAADKIIEGLEKVAGLRQGSASSPVSNDFVLNNLYTEASNLVVVGENKRVIDMVKNGRWQELWDSPEISAIISYIVRDAVDTDTIGLRRNFIREVVFLVFQAEIGKVAMAEGRPVAQIRPEIEALNQEQSKAVDGFFKWFQVAIEAPAFEKFKKENAGSSSPAASSPVSQTQEELEDTLILLEPLLAEFAVAARMKENPALPSGAKFQEATRLMSQLYGLRSQATRFISNIEKIKPGYILFVGSGEVVLVLETFRRPGAARGGWSEEEVDSVPCYGGWGWSKDKGLHYTTGDSSTAIFNSVGLTPEAIKKLLFEQLDKLETPSLRQRLLRHLLWFQVGYPDAESGGEKKLAAFLKQDRDFLSKHATAPSTRPVQRGTLIFDESSGAVTIISHGLGLDGYHHDKVTTAWAGLKLQQRGKRWEDVNGGRLPRGRMITRDDLQQLIASLPKDDAASSPLSPGERRDLLQIIQSMLQVRHDSGVSGNERQIYFENHWRIDMRIDSFPSGKTQTRVTLRNGSGHEMFTIRYKYDLGLSLPVESIKRSFIDAIRRGDDSSSPIVDKNAAEDKGDNTVSSPVGLKQQKEIRKRIAELSATIEERRNRIEQIEADRARNSQRLREMGYSSSSDWERRTLREQNQRIDEAIGRIQDHIGQLSIELGELEKKIGKEIRSQSIASSPVETVTLGNDANHKIFRRHLDIAESVGRNLQQRIKVSRSGEIVITRQELQQQFPEVAYFFDELPGMLSVHSRLSMQEVSGRKDVFKVSSSVSSSPVGMEEVKAVGGIDFRSLPMTCQPMGNFCNLDLSLSRPSGLEEMNFDEELVQIQQMVDSGMVPSGERVKEFIAACYYKKTLADNQEALMRCLMRICKLEEDKVEGIDKELKEALVLVDAF